VAVHKSGATELKIPRSSVDWPFYAMCYYKIVCGCGCALIPLMILVKPNASYFVSHHFLPEGNVDTSLMLSSLFLETYSMYSSFVVIIVDELAIFTIHVIYVGSVLSTLK